MSTLSSANVIDVNLVLKERTHMRLCINMLIFMHNLGNWLIYFSQFNACWQVLHKLLMWSVNFCLFVIFLCCHIQEQQKG